MASIHVAGLGVVHREPDTISVGFSVQRVNKSYELAVSGLVEAERRVRTRAVEAGIPESILLTRRLRVEEDTKYVNQQHVHTGWIAKQELSVELPFSQESLATVGRSFFAEDDSVSCSVGFRLAAEGEAEAAALRLAVAHATSCARATAEAAGCTLGPVESIVVGDADPIATSRTTFSEATLCCASPEMPTINPDAIEIERTVTMSFSLEQANKPEGVPPR